VGAVEAAIPNMMTAALVEAVIIGLACALVELEPADSVPGKPSKGVAPEVSTPEKATMPPAALVTPEPRVKV
jgi:hypothetical protein